MTALLAVAKRDFFTSCRRPRCVVLRVPGLTGRRLPELKRLLSMSPQKIEHDIVERAGLLPGHGVTGIVDSGPFVILQMRRP